MENRQTKTFETRGPVKPERNYVVARTEELADFINRVKEGRYVVIFAPRQTGKTTFFRRALEQFATEDSDYFPLALSFQIYQNVAPAVFYKQVCRKMRQGIEKVFSQRGQVLSEALAQFLADTTIADHVEMLNFFQELAGLLTQRVVIIIDEFDGIPQAALSDFLYTLRDIYLEDDTSMRCPYSVGIVGVKSITQLNYDRSISPFNIQDEFALPNFTLAQVQELLGQYTDEVGQVFAPEVIEMLHRQTAGQPFLVNRLAQILTAEMDIPKTETITVAHFAKAHAALLQEQNVNFHHLTTNVRRHPQFERILMDIATSEKETRFNPESDMMNELLTYGIITKDARGVCRVVNPIYQRRVLQAFEPGINGLRYAYFPEDSGIQFSDYLTADGHLAMQPLLDNFRDFIARIGFRILQEPDLPRESIGQHLLATYLDAFVRTVRGNMYLELPTGRGRMDLVVLHRERKYIVEFKIWGSERGYQSGKQQLAAYLQLEAASEGYYVVFDHRENPEPRTETETVDGSRIRSYVIPVVQERPSDLSEEEEAYRRSVVRKHRF